LNEPAPVSTLEPAAAASRYARAGLRWWHELGFAGAFYGVYSIVRNTQGSAAVSDVKALRNALDVIRLEETLGLYFERAVQNAFIGWRAFIEFWNLFYGTFHFAMTVMALVLLYRRFPERYRRWRNTLAVATGAALLGFATFPLMPPRLLPQSYGFIDTLRDYGSLWSFDSGAMHKISNQYAAMPSLHFAWSVWSACVLFTVLRRPWTRALALLYPAATLFAVVVTANHYVLDAVGGVVAFGIGALIGFPLAVLQDDRFFVTGVTPVPVESGHP